MGGFRRAVARTVDPAGIVKGNKVLDPAQLTKTDAMDAQAEAELAAKKKADAEKLAYDQAAATAAATGPAMADLRRRLGLDRQGASALSRRPGAVSTVNANAGTGTKLG